FCVASAEQDHGSESPDFIRRAPTPNPGLTWILSNQEEDKMRNRIFGLIGVLWGGGIIVSGLVRGGSQGAGAYQLGQTAGFVFGGLLFVVGLFYLIRGSGKKTAPPKE
ncbi:MAG: hypothetical protein ACKO8U_16190, partial [Pirellula sp.]